jgi:hypothetical protein
MHANNETQVRNLPLVYGNLLACICFLSEKPMRYLILITCLALAGTAFAKEEPKSLAKEIDKSSPLLTTSDDSSDTSNSSAAGQRGVVAPRDAASGMSTGKRQHGQAGADSGSSSGGTRAQDYNSSRSNNINGAANRPADLDRDGRPDVLTCGNGADDDCNGTDRAASPANHNTTRSNRTRAENYNSTRSNKAGARLDSDSDDDSTLKEVRCSMANEDCVTSAGGDGNDLVLRKRPGKK